jgi:hypothetical protein
VMRDVLFRHLPPWEPSMAAGPQDIGEEVSHRSARCTIPSSTSLGTVHAAGPQDIGEEVSHRDARCTIPSSTTL